MAELLKIEARGVQTLLSSEGLLKNVGIQPPLAVPFYIYIFLDEIGCAPTDMLLEIWFMICDEIDMSVKIKDE